MRLDERAARVELLRALAVLCEPPTPEHAAVAEALGLGPAPDGAAYARIFTFQLYPYASVHLGPEGMMGGVARDRIAGFWTAVGVTPPPAEPDHLSALLGLYAGLLEEEGAATGSAGAGNAAGSSFASPGTGAGPTPDHPARAALMAHARAALFHEHLAPWVFEFLDRVSDTDEGFYAAWAGTLRTFLRDEAANLPRPEGLPSHLREAPALADPREEGAAAFLEGVTAPVRTGMILTRSDLVRMARGLDLGVRLGERRYILEHLLGQDAAGTLAALAAEAGRAAERHEERLDLLGKTGSFWVERARRTEGLLGELAEEAAGAASAVQWKEVTESPA